LIVSENLLEDRDYKPVIIAVEDAYISFQVLMNLYQEMQGRKTGIEEGSFFHDTAQVGEGVYIGAFTYVSEKAKIGETHRFFHMFILVKVLKIGKNCKIDSGARIYDYCIVGDNCVIHSNTVIGGDGFGFQPTADGFKKFLN
jgi:UDP-3-O-[3-hydroxymyristoyl] glucosamine N-acyltransferase